MLKRINYEPLVEVKTFDEIEEGQFFTDIAGNLYLKILWLTQVSSNTSYNAIEFEEGNVNYCCDYVFLDGDEHLYIPVDVEMNVDRQIQEK